MSGKKLDKLDSVSFDEYLNGRNPFEGATAVFDLSGIKFVSPSALVQLTAACHALAAAGRAPKIVGATDDVRDYLMRVSFFSTLDGVAAVEPEVPRFLKALYQHRVGTNPLLIEVTKIASGNVLPALLDQIVTVLRRRLRYRKNDAFDVATAVSELCQNTFDHNANTCGFIAMQVYGKGTSRFLEIGVADHGFGLKATLSRNPRNTGIGSDIEAIRQAIQLGTSEHDDQTRGTGLHHLLDIAYKHRGRVQIRSGNGKVRYRMDQRMGWAFQVPHVPGVQATLTLSTKATA